VSYGRFPQARAVLSALGALSGNRQLAHCEYIVALQCGTPCMNDEELARLARMARDALQRDGAAGSFKRYAEKFSARLAPYIDTAGLRLGTMPTGSAREAEEESMWQVVHAQLERLKRTRQTDQEREYLHRRVAELASSQGSQFSLYSIWGWVYEQVDLGIEEMDSERPEIPDAETPIRRSGPGARERSRALARQWRQHLDAPDPAARQSAFDGIRGFFDEEQRLDEIWLRRRREAIVQPAARLRNLTRQAADLLSRIEDSAPAAAAWPGFLDIDIGEACRADARALRDELAARMASAVQAWETAHG